jgi:hypothetical protein
VENESCCYLYIIIRVGAGVDELGREQSGLVLASARASSQTESVNVLTSHAGGNSQEAAPAQTMTRILVKCSGETSSAVS